MENNDGNDDLEIVGQRFVVPTSATGREPQAVPGGAASRKRRPEVGPRQAFLFPSGHIWCFSWSPAAALKFVA